MSCRCPNCGATFSPDDDFRDDPIAQLREEAARQGFHVDFRGLVTEAAAAALLGYAGADSLRKQVEFGKNRLNFVRRGNRRFYRLEDIAEFIG